MNPNDSLAATLGNTLVAPKAAFTTLIDRPRWGWIAFALIVIVQSVAVLAFFAPMSPEWVVEQQMLRLGDLQPSEEPQVRAQLAEIAPHHAVLGAVLGSVMLGLLLLVLGLYLFVADRIGRGSRLGYGAWLRFAVWTQLPLLAYALGLIVIALLAADPDQSFSVSQYASVNNLLLHLPLGHPWFNWAEQLNLFHLWSIVLGAIGWRVWTGSPHGRALLVAALPYVLVFGGWALLK